MTGRLARHKTERLGTCTRRMIARKARLEGGIMEEMASLQMARLTAASEEVETDSCDTLLSQLLTPQSSLGLQSFDDGLLGVYCRL